MYEPLSLSSHTHKKSTVACKESQKEIITLRFAVSVNKHGN